MKISILKNLLNSRNDISQWAIASDIVKEYQFFGFAEIREENRVVSSLVSTVDLYHIQGKLQGKSSFSLLPHEMERSIIENKIDKSIDLSKKFISNRLHFLQQPETYHNLKTSDPKVRDNPLCIADEIIDGIRKIINREKNIKLATSEIFITLSEYYYCNSRGQEGSFKRSRVFVDLVFMAEQGNEEAESHAEIDVRAKDKLNVEEIAYRHIKYAKDKLSAKLPPSGNIPVIISREALIPLFEPFIFHSSGKTIDMGISMFKKGKPVIRNESYKGDAITLYSNPRIPYGLRTFPIDRDGVPSKTVKIIENGIFKNLWATKEYADYLKLKPTGEFGNILVKNGGHYLNKLSDDNKFLHIVEFSFMHPDMTSGDFSDEIRLGYLKLNGKTIPVRGGSISGNVFSSFGNAEFSNETYESGKYNGPLAIKFQNLTVSGS